MTGLLFLALVTCAQYVRYAKLGILCSDEGEGDENERSKQRGVSLNYCERNNPSTTHTSPMCPHGSPICLR